MKTLKYINPLGEELIFTNSAPFILQKYTQGTGVNNYSTKSSGQDGEAYVGSTIGETDISLEIGVKGQTNELYRKYREILRQQFNPKLGQGTLIFNDGENDYSIRCSVEKIPFLTDINNRSGKGVVSLLANDPLWEDLVEQREEIAYWIGDFSFELEIPIDTGIEMGHREPSLIVNCLNEGDTESGMRIEFKALATLTNPSLFNVNTREFIKINKSMDAGETISVTTYFGNKQIISTLNGVESNAFNYIDPGSTFLQLDKGDNLLRYDAETGLDNLEVYIYHKNRFLGV